MRDSCIDEGYAELEGNDTLYVYGNAYEIVLSNSDFHPIIKKVSVLVYSDLFLDQLLIFPVRQPCPIQIPAIFKKVRIFRRNRHKRQLHQLLPLDLKVRGSTISQKPNHFKQSDLCLLASQVLHRLQVPQP